MFGNRRRSAAALDVRFCDGCAEVTTAGQRARRRFEHDRAAVQAWGWLR